MHAAEVVIHKGECHHRGGILKLLRLASLTSRLLCEPIRKTAWCSAGNATGPHSHHEATAFQDALRRASHRRPTWKSSRGWRSVKRTRFERTNNWELTLLDRRALLQLFEPVQDHLQLGQ
jgi:hypothetical protein